MAAAPITSLVCLNRGARLNAARAAHVRIDRHAPLGSDAKHVNHFQPGCSRCVLNAHANGQAAGVKFRAQTILYLRDLLGSRRLIGGGTALGQDVSGRQRISEYQSPRSHMACRSAVMNQRVAFFAFQKLRDIRCADFQFQRHGHAVKRFNALALQVLRVLMQIDEARRHYQSVGVNHPASTQRLGRDADNLFIANPDVAHRIQASFGVHNAPIFQHQIELPC
jgi:hypothetical protein